MNYYQVAVNSQKYRGNDYLTYQASEKLAVGTIVGVTVRNFNSLGIVCAVVPKPTFAAKEITSVIKDITLPSTSLELFIWLGGYYPGPISSIVNRFIPTSLAAKSHKSGVITVHSGLVSRSTIPPLTNEQKNVLQSIKLSAEKTFLLHGATGSGKTRIYLELTKKQLQKNISVLVLTPEIGLTSQLEMEFEEWFPDQVVVLHSHLTVAEKRQLWLQILNSSVPLVIIGPRSALFAPFRKLGLVVVDEAHDTAYKEEQTPRYNTLRVASKLASIHKARLVFGTATPLVSEYYIAGQKNIPILRMRTQAANTNTTPALIETVSLRERHQFSRWDFLSDSLIQAIQQTLDRNEQTLIFLNRRGTARLVICHVCGWQNLCPNCDLPLTYHQDEHTMMCHTCGYKTTTPSNCPICDSTDIIFRSTGTKAVVSALERLFPKAQLQRFDNDNTKPQRLENNLVQMRNGDVDIVVGTQILAKGLDLPHLGLVGVIVADSSLYFPDYTSSEQTYQLLSQVIGRVGRGHRPGKAIIQTYSPNDTAIRAAANNDWLSFYKQQLRERKQFLFPPFCYLLKISGVRKKQAAIAEAITELRHNILKLRLKIAVIGPTPAFREKSQAGYRWQLVIKTKNRNELLKVISWLPANWTYDLDPTNLL